MNQPGSRKREWIGFGYIDHPTREEAIGAALQKLSGADRNGAERFLSELRRLGFRIVAEEEMV